VFVDHKEARSSTACLDSFHAASKVGVGMAKPIVDEPSSASVVDPGVLGNPGVLGISLGIGDLAVASDEPLNSRPAWIAVAGHVYIRVGYQTTKYKLNSTDD
jgi:hypothetical protein